MTIKAVNWFYFQRSWVGTEFVHFACLFAMSGIEQRSGNVQTEVDDTKHLDIASA
jgi:hypothetical protein